MKKRKARRCVLVENPSPKLPERVANSARKFLKKRLARKAGRSPSSGRALLRTDPSRTLSLRRHMSQTLRRQFARIKALVFKLVVDDDAFGLAQVANLSIADRVEAAASQTDTSPTPQQVEAGNYRKGRVTVQGIPVTIENPAGSTRTKYDEDGEPKWSREMACHYGYVNRTLGVDGDHVDVFLGPRPESDRVFVVDQLREDGGFDEHKCLLGFLDRGSAVAAYLANYPKGWRLGPVTECTVAEFKEWLGSEMSRNAFCPTGGGGGVDPSCGRPGTSVDPNKVRIGDKIQFLSHRGEVTDFGQYKDLKAKYPDAIVVAGRDADESKFGRCWAVKFDDGLRLVGSAAFRLLLKHPTANYSVEEFRRDAWEAAYQQFPELREWHEKYPIGNEATGVEPVRQGTDYDCGAAAAMAVGCKFGVGPRTLAGWRELLDTNKRDGTDAGEIEDGLRSLGLRVRDLTGMSVSDLKGYTDRGWPVICPVQDWGGGHWVVVVDVNDDYVIVADSSREAEDGSIEVPGVKAVAREDWVDAWHDEDADGRELVRYGIAVGPEMASNAFCPTGEGGGIDPGCGRGYGSNSASEVGNQKAEKWVADQESWRGKVETSRTNVSGKDIQPAPGVAITKSAVAKYAKQIEKAVANGEPLRPIVVAKNEQGKWFTHDGNHYFHAIVSLKRAGKLQALKELPAIEVRAKPGYKFESRILPGDMFIHDLVEDKQTRNTFCATGEGGGVDPSCSPHGIRVGTVSGKLPKAAQAMIRFGLKDIRVHEDSEALTKHLRKEGHKIEDAHREASYDRRGKILHLTKDAPDSVIAHELGHVIDSYDEHISSEPKFRRAWKQEGHKLSDYAASHPAEGLAELYRLRHEQGQKAVEKLAPKMTAALGAYWKGKPTRNSSMTEAEWMAVEGHPGAVYYDARTGEPSFVDNSFCPTGSGGGVDPSCSPSGHSVGDVVSYKGQTGWKVIGKSRDGNKVALLRDGRMAQGVKVSELQAAERVSSSTAGPSAAKAPSVTSGGELSTDEKSAVLKYSEGGYFGVNGILRGQKGLQPSEEISKRIELLDSAIKKSTLSEGRTLYRGIFNKAHKGVKEGAVLDDPAYLSTSLSDKHIKEFKKKYLTSLEIEAPAGSHALHVDPLVSKERREKSVKDGGGPGTEDEVLLPRGSKLLVTSVEHSEEGGRVRVRIRARILPADHATSNVLLLNYDGQPRDEHGRFGSGGQGGDSHVKATADQLLHDYRDMSDTDWREVGGMAREMEHVAKEWIADRCESAVSKLPAPLQAGVRASYAAVRAGVGVAFSAWRANQALAERVSIERGSTPEQARRLRGVLSAIDLAAFKPLAVATAGSAVASGASWVVPPATGAYLAYSTARDPMATFRAASGLVRESLGRAVGGAFDRLHPLISNSTEDRARVLADALEASGYDDWYLALLSSAVDECGDVRDAIGLANRLYAKNAGVTANAGQFSFHADADKIRAFQEWLKQQMMQEVIGHAQEQLWENYINAGYQKGAGRAFDDATAARRALSGDSQQKLDFYAGSREDFLKSSFGRPVSKEKVKLLAGRSFDDLENVTSEMSTKMSRVLTDGLVQGKSPRAVAKDMVDQVDVSRNRAELVSRTEIIRVHAEGQLDALENMGASEVGVAVEWMVSDPSLPEKEGGPCPLCMDLNGVVLKIEEARGMLPRHPNCKCCFLPANVGEDDGDQIRSKRGIESAIGGGDYGPAVEISTGRPQSILNADPEPVQNAFCPTGPGGGVDPSCSLHDPQGEESDEEAYEEASPTLREGETKLPWKMKFPENEEEGGVGAGRGKAFEAAWKRWADAGRPNQTQREIPIGEKDIYVGQAGVRPRIVKLKMDGILPMSDIHAYKFQGKYYIDDGHHTLLAQKLLGKKKVMADLSDLDAPLPKKRRAENNWVPAPAQNAFCATGVGGGIDPSCSPAGVHQTHIPTDEEHRHGLTPAPCCPSHLVPDATHARVGVPAMSVPPPPKNGIPRLPNLTPDQRAVETRFAEKFIANPDKMVGKYREALAAGKVGVAPNVYATDDVKMLNRDWNPSKVKQGQELTEESRDAMAKYNTAVHQTANAIAKRAFVEHLDEMAKLPDGHPLKSVLVTNGGCAAGKGSTLSHAAEPDSPYNKITPAAHQVGAVWDAAGEQNATENEWIHRECSKRGITPTFAYVWANPKDGWDSSDRGVIRRAVRKGRMVDAALFADSYAEGAKNMHDFTEKHKDDGTKFIFIDNRKKGEPKLLDSFPKETLSWDSGKIRQEAVRSLRSHAEHLSKPLVQAGLAGETIWGPSGA